MLCKYKDIFGKPNEGVHKIRIFGLAFVDLFLTVLLSILIGYYTNRNIFLVFICLMILSVIVHKIFCVETALTKLL